MFVRRRARLTLLLIITVVLAAACSDGGSSSSPSSARWKPIAPTTKSMCDGESKAMDAAAERALADSGGQLPAMWLGVWKSDIGRYVYGYGDAEAAKTPA